MKVLLDAHHSDLLEAMHRLFEDRLGMECHVASGMEFYHEGIAPYGQEDVARQFLEGPLDGFHDRQYRRITLPEVRASSDWVAMCATMAEQQWGFKRLADEMGARFMIQVGNARQHIDWTLDPLVIGAGYLAPHQEFDKDGEFRFSPLSGDPHTVASFVNIFPLLPDYRHFTEAEILLPDWLFSVYGHHGRDGFVKPTSVIADLMRRYAFGWHDKETGDGYGHVCHYWAAIGRPLIGHASYYRGQVAEDLWTDGVTCIDLDRHSVHEATEMMRTIAADPIWYESMCKAIRDRLDARIDYAREAAQVSEALGLLVTA